MIIKRKCQGCKETFNRDELIKITKLANGTLKINPSSLELGRSAYVCKNPQCIKNVLKKNRIKGALKGVDSKEILKIEEELKQFIVE